METKEVATEDYIDLKEIFSLLMKNLWIIILATVICAGIGFSVTNFLMTPIYQADATMIVNTRQDLQSTVTNDQITSAKNLVDTYAIIITSRTVLQPVIDALGLDMTYEQLAANVTVSSVNNTQVMRVAVKDPDPVQAQNIVTQIISSAPDIIIDTVEAGSVKTVSAPHAGEKPVSPNKRTNTAMAGLLGAVICVGILILRDLLDNTFKDEHDITRQLGLPILGIIPSIESCKKGGRH